MSSEFKSLWNRREELQSLANDLKNRKYAIFTILHPSLKQDFLPKMNSEKVRGIIVVSICDGLSWGWCSKFTDYRFVVPKDGNKKKYARLAQMMLKRMINADIHV